MEAIATCKKNQLELAVGILRGFGELQFRARGTSMAPAIFPGDILYVERKSIAELQTGHVILFYRDGHFCAHRVIRVNGGTERLSVTTQGDALTGEDPDTYEEHLLGRVTTIIRGYSRIRMKERASLVNRAVRRLIRRSEWFASLLVRWHEWRTQTVHDINNDPESLKRDVVAECF